MQQQKIRFKASTLSMAKQYLAWVIIALFGSYGLLVAWLRHDTFHSLGLDMAVFNQVFWNTIHGRFWEFSLELSKATPHSYLANHFSPLLFLLIPLYAIAPTVHTLLTLQSLALALGAVPIYLFAKTTLQNTTKSLIVLLVYFFSPFVQNINLFDFHEIAFFVPLFGFCLLAMFRKRWRWFWLFLILSLCVKEEVGLVGVALGLYLLTQKRYKIGFAVSLLSLTWFVVALKIIIPHFSGSEYNYTAYRYQDFGTSLNQILPNMILHPLHTLAVLTRPAKLYFVAILLFSTGLIGLLGGTFLICLIPSLLYLLLANYPGQYSYTTQYAAVLLPTLFFAMILGLQKSKAYRLNQWIYPAILVMAVTTTALFGALPFSRRFAASQWSMAARYQSFATMQAMIPENASLAAQDYVLSHLANRRLLEMYSDNTTADFIWLDAASSGDNIILYDHTKEIQLNRGYRLVYCPDTLCLMTKLSNHQ